MHILLQLTFFFHQTNGVIRNIIGVGKATVFVVRDRFLMCFPWRKVLVFGDARIGHIGVAIVHHCTALEVAIVYLAFEVERAISQAAMLETEICIDGATPHHVIGAGKVGTRLHHTQGDGDAGVIENIGHNGRVSVTRNGLIWVIEVRIVVVKAHR